MSEADRQSRPNVGYFSPFVPPEWIAAHGATPVLLTFEGGDATHGRASASASSRRGVCSCAGDLVDRLSQGERFAESLQAVVLPTSCDQLRYASALLGRRFSKPLFLLNVPSTWNTPASRSYYADELRRLGRFLEQWDGASRPDRRALSATMRTFDAARNEQRSSWERSAQESSEGEPRLALVGGPVFASQKAELVDGLNRLGARLVLDASEFGERTLPDAFRSGAMDDDPFEELVRAYFDTIPDVFRRPDAMLFDWLERRFQERNVQGVLLRRYVFCDLWNGVASRIRARFGLPTLDLHVGQGEDAAAGRTWGRIEAFLECWP